MAPYVETKCIADRLLDGLEHWIGVLLHYIIGGGRHVKTNNCVNWKRELTSAMAMAMDQNNESGVAAAGTLVISNSSDDNDDTISIGSSMGSYSSNEDDDERRAATISLSDSEEEQLTDESSQLDWLDERFDRAARDDSSSRYIEEIAWLALFSIDSGLTRRPQTEHAAETAPAFGSMRSDKDKDKDKDGLHVGNDLTEGDVCQICLIREKRYALVPCGHIFCGYCCDKITSRRLRRRVDDGEGTASFVWKCHKCCGEVICFLRIYNN